MFLFIRGERWTIRSRLYQSQRFTLQTFFSTTRFSLSSVHCPFMWHRLSVILKDTMEVVGQSWEQTHAVILWPLLGLEDSPFKGSALKRHWKGLRTSAGHPDAHTMQIVWGNTMCSFSSSCWDRQKDYKSENSSQIKWVWVCSTKLSQPSTIYTHQKRYIWFCGD